MVKHRGLGRSLSAFAVKRLRSPSGSDVKIRNHIHKDCAPRGHTAEAGRAKTLPCVFRVFFAFLKNNFPLLLLGHTTNISIFLSLISARLRFLSIIQVPTLLSREGC